MKIDDKNIQIYEESITFAGDVGVVRTTVQDGLLKSTVFIPDSDLPISPDFCEEYIDLLNEEA